MAIYKSTPPEAANVVATDRLASLERARGRVHDVEAGGGIADPKNCLPVYHIDAGMLADPMHSLSNANPVGWQYLIESGGVMQIVEVIGEQVVSVDSGRSGHNINHALAIAEQNLPQQEYQARMLTFGRAENPVLWLHPDKGDDERFFTLGSTPHEVAPTDVLDRAAYAHTVRTTKSFAPSHEPDDECGG